MCHHQIKYRNTEQKWIIVWDIKQGCYTKQKKEYDLECSSNELVPDHAKEFQIMNGCHKGKSPA
jgi:hypothetical protein